MEPSASSSSRTCPCPMDGRRQSSQALRLPILKGENMFVFCWWLQRLMKNIDKRLEKKSTISWHRAVFMKVTVMPCQNASGCRASHYLKTQSPVFRGVVLQGLRGKVRSHKNPQKDCGRRNHCVSGSPAPICVILFFKNTFWHLFLNLFLPVARKPLQIKSCEDTILSAAGGEDKNTLTADVKEQAAQHLFSTLKRSRDHCI